MADVTLPWAAQKVVVDLDTCIKTGRRTNETVTLRGSTTPGWVTLLLLISIIGFLLVSGMTSRRYEITVPFTHDSHDRWVTRRRQAWVIGLVGAVTFVAAMAADGRAEVVSTVGLVLVLGAALAGTVNGWRNGIGVRLNRDHDLVLSGTHPDFAASFRGASVEPLKLG